MSARLAPPALRPARRSPALGDGAAGWQLIYDADCAFCRQSIGLLRRWDRTGRLMCVPLTDARALTSLPAIPRSALEEAMHLVTPDRRVLAGGLALPEILRLLPGGAPLARLFRVPGVPRVAARLYRLIARNRHRLGCGSTACKRGD